MFRRSLVVCAGGMLVVCLSADPESARGAPPGRNFGRPVQGFNPAMQPALYGYPALHAYQAMHAYPAMQVKANFGRPVHGFKQPPQPKPPQPKPPPPKPKPGHPKPKPGHPHPHGDHDEHNHGDHRHHRGDHEGARGSGRFGSGFSWGQWNAGFGSAGGLMNPYMPGGGALDGQGLGGAGSPGGFAPGGFDGGAGNPNDIAGILQAYGDALREIEEMRARQGGPRTPKNRADAEGDLKPKTWSEEQAEIAGRILVRARAADESAINSAQALNVLLDDLRKLKGAPRFSGAPLSQETLTHINVTAKKQGNLGLLRNGSTFTWPDALADDAILSKQEREGIELKARAAVQQAMHGNVAKDLLGGLRRFVHGTREKLFKRINSIAGNDYLNAKRFLNNLESAGLALERGEAIPYFRFQNWLDKGKTIQDVADYMIREGLYFAATVPGDEQAYRALHGALAAYNVELHQQATGVASARIRN